MSEPAAKMLDELERLQEASEPPWRELDEGNGSYDARCESAFEREQEYIALLRNAAPRLLALVRASVPIADRMRLILQDGCECGEDGCICGYYKAKEELAAYDAASRGAGQRGEGTNG